MTGSVTSPLSMLIIGALLADVPFRGIRGAVTYIGQLNEADRYAPDSL